jgi:hypothetical protein
MDINDIKKLPAEERLKKLKEIAESREKEIKEAQALMKQSEAELDQQKALKEQIPIPQLIAEQETTLTTGEEREMFDVHRFKSKVEEQKENATIQKKEHEEELEVTVRKEAPRTPIPAEAQYGALLDSQQPIQYFAEQFNQFREKIYQVGGFEKLPKEEQLHFEYTARDWDEKLETITEGDYNPPTNDAFRSAVVTEHLRHKLQSMYKSQAGGEKTRNLRKGYEEEEPSYNPS